MRAIVRLVGLLHALDHCHCLAYLSHAVCHDVFFFVPRSVYQADKNVLSVATGGEMSFDARCFCI